MENKDFLTNLTSDELASYRLESFPGRVIVIENMENFRRHLPELKGEGLLGFDTETKPSFRKGKRNRVALLQLAFDNTAFLFRLNRIGLPRELAQILADAMVVKAGVAIHDDIKILRQLSQFEPSGFVDLQKTSKEFGIESSSLKKLAAIILGFRISKSQQVTDWEAPVLSEAQIIYAATDAWVCYEIYLKLSRLKQ